MIIPYKVKNPPKHFPVVTAAIIVLNVLVYALTTHHGLVIRQDAVDQYALRWGESPLVTLFTAMFLHAGPFHLIGNMLFLWVFGPAVEDRLRIGSYLLLYFFAGFAGYVAQAMLSAAGAVGSGIPTLGASGCIMGVLGAYWYLYSWSPVCVFYWIYFSLFGTFEIAAIWVIGAYVAMDLLNGLLARQFGIVGGVANFAHVGGALAGATLVWVLKFKRDPSEVSRAKAVHADMKSMDLLDCDELEKLVSHSPDDEELLLSYAKRAWQSGETQHLNSALSRNPRAVLTSCPDAVVDYLFTTGQPPQSLSPGDLLFLGQHCEGSQQLDRAIRVYELVETCYPDAREVELALYRAASVCFQTTGGACKAQDKLNTLLAKFPNGALTLEAEDLLGRISKRYSTDTQAA